MSKIKDEMSYKRLKADNAKENTSCQMKSPEVLVNCLDVLSYSKFGTTKNSYTSTR